MGKPNKNQTYTAQEDYPFLMFLMLHIKTSFD